MPPSFFAGDLGTVGASRYRREQPCWRSLLELGDELAADDNTIGVLADLDKVLACRDTEADGERDGVMLRILEMRSGKEVETVVVGTRSCPSWRQRR